MSQEPSDRWCPVWNSWMSTLCLSNHGRPHMNRVPECAHTCSHERSVFEEHRTPTFLAKIRRARPQARLSSWSLRIGGLPEVSVSSRRGPIRRGENDGACDVHTYGVHTAYMQAGSFCATVMRTKCRSVSQVWYVCQTDERLV
jgi:hypothetical protein